MKRLIAIASLAAILASCDKDEYNYITVVKGDTIVINNAMVDKSAIDSILISRVDTIVVVPGGNGDTDGSTDDGKADDEEDESTLKAVDMGLSVKWASMNVGAVRTYGYGRYFAWGEIETKGKFSDDNYKWRDASSSSLTKYNETDNLTSLDADDDVATQMLGHEWRTPTADEMSELANPMNCAWVWTSDYKNSGIAGFMVVSNTTGGRIFMPSAGYFGIYGDTNGLSSNNTYYWTASLSSSKGYTYAQSLFLNHMDDTNISVVMKDSQRGCGYAVRAVSTME